MNETWDPNSRKGLRARVDELEHHLNTVMRYSGRSPNHFSMVEGKAALDKPRERLSCGMSQTKSNEPTKAEIAGQLALVRTGLHKLKVAAEFAVGNKTEHAFEVLQAALDAEEVKDASG